MDLKKKNRKKIPAAFSEVIDAGLYESKTRLNCMYRNMKEGFD